GKQDNGDALVEAASDIGAVAGPGAAMADFDELVAAVAKAPAEAIVDALAVVEFWAFKSEGQCFRLDQFALPPGGVPARHIRDAGPDTPVARDDVLVHVFFERAPFFPITDRVLLPHGGTILVHDRILHPQRLEYFIVHESGKRLLGDARYDERQQYVVR